MNDLEVYQDNTSDIIYVRPGPLNAGDAIDVAWSCKIAVSDFNGNVVITERDVPDKVTVPIENDDKTTSNEETFMCFLTPTETDTLEEDNKDEYHTLVIKVSNLTTTPPFKLSTHSKLKVKKKIIS